MAAWFWMLQVPTALGEPGFAPDETGEQEDDTVVLPAREPRTPSGGAACSLDTGITAAVDVVVVDGTASVAFPELPEVASWRLDARVYWRGARIDGSQSADAATTVEVAVPPAAHVEAMQDEWPSRVRVVAVGLDGFGNEVGRAELEELWVVRPEGAQGSVRWLDRATRTQEAPVDAWSATARLLVAALEVEEGHVLEVEPPAEVTP